MKQKMFTIWIERHPAREELRTCRGQKGLAAMDKLLYVLTELAMLTLIAVALVGLAHDLTGWTPKTPSSACAPVQVKMGLTGSSIHSKNLVIKDPDPITYTAAPDEATETAIWDTPLTASELEALLETCTAGHIDPSIGLGLIQTESDFDPDAVNPVSGCYGYCQLNPKYFPVGLTPEENIRTGIEYLAQQLDRYDNLGAALTAYNAGHDTGDRTYAEQVIAASVTFRG